MEPRKPSVVFALLQKSHPWALLGGALFFALGTGIAHYLGYTIDWLTYLLGQLGVTLLQLASYYLNAYYDLLTTELTTGKQTAPGGARRSGELQIAILSLTAGAVITILLFLRGDLKLAAFLVLGIAFVLAFFYAVPPLRLAYSGYGELIYAFILTNLVPAFAFLLQTGTLHRLLAMLTFPLTALFLAYSLAAELPGYATDLKSGRQSLMLRLGWQNGMSMHNILVLAAYFLIGTAAVLGLPWSLTWPALLAFPIGIYQIWQMIQITNGVRPNWRMLTFTAAATLTLTAYLIAFNLWAR